MFRELFGKHVDFGVSQPPGVSAQSYLPEALLMASLMFIITADSTATMALGQLAAIMIESTVGVKAL